MSKIKSAMWETWERELLDGPSINNELSEGSRQPVKPELATSQFQTGKPTPLMSEIKQEHLA